MYVLYKNSYCIEKTSQYVYKNYKIGYIMKND